MDIRQVRDYFNTKPVEFVIKERYELIEDYEYIPRFSIKNVWEIADIPINKPIKCTEKVLIKAIKYGMIFLISYKGAEDTHFAGHERVIYPMVLGRSSKGKLLLRAWHLNGWSVSYNRHVEKIWRLFRVDRILSMTFTGSFYRLPPAGYNMNDRGMRGGIIARADFSEIRRNQQKLLNQGMIQNKEDISLGDDKIKFATVKVKKTDTQLDLSKPLDNVYIKNIKDLSNARISFLKSIYGNRYLAILGAMGQPGNTVKIVDDKNIQLGVYKVLDSITGDVLKKIKRVKGNSLYPLYLFNKKI